MAALVDHTKMAGNPAARVHLNGSHPAFISLLYAQPFRTMLTLQYECECTLTGIGLRRVAGEELPSNVGGVGPESTGRQRHHGLRQRRTRLVLDAHLA